MRRQRAFSLIEVMVTLVVVSLAALGTAGLQTVAVRMNHNALLESQASTLAQDIIERIRANQGGNYTTGFDAVNLIENAPFCAGLAANCSGDDMAQHDLVDWKCALGFDAIQDVCQARGIPGQLPDGDGSIAIAGNTYVITVRWYDSAQAAVRQIAFTAMI